MDHLFFLGLLDDKQNMSIFRVLLFAKTIEYQFFSFNSPHDVDLLHQYYSAKKICLSATLCR